MKPLVLFSSLAVLCAGGLMALSYEGWQDDPSALTSLSSGSQTVNIKPAEAVSTPPATQPSADTKAATAETKTVEPEKPEEKLAAVMPKQDEVAPSVETAPVETAPVAKLGDVTAKPEPAEAETQSASFDIVRVEEDGSAVLAGRSAPGVTVRLLINEVVAGETQANDRGEWVVIPVEPMPAGAHQMQIETENAAGEVRRAEQSVALTVPDQPGTQPLIVLSETAKPSKVLQKPEPQQTKQAEAVPETQQPAAQGTATADNTQKTAAAGEQASAEEAAESKTAALQPPAAAPASTPRKLTVDVVDYNDAGLTTFSGRSAPDSRVRVYVDNRFTGETTAGSDGLWAFTAGREIASGPHTLRTDEISPGGEVTERIELPFFRESPERIAGLQAQRKEAVEQEAVKPEPATTAAADTTEKIAVAETEVEAAKPDVQAETKQPAQVQAATGTMVESKVADGVETVQEAETQVAEKPEMEVTQQTSGIKGDAEIVKTEVAPAAAEAESSQQTATVGDAAEEVKPEATEQTAVVETAVEPAKSEPARQQVAAVEPVAEPAKPADVNSATEQTAPTEEMAKPVQEPASVETAAVVTEAEQAETVTPSTGKVVIQPGNNLWQISRVIYGKGRQYTVIYDANKEQIRDPNRIYPGQIFETPGSDAPESIDPACRVPLAECN